MYVGTSVTSRVFLCLDSIFNDYLHVYLYAQRVDDFLTFRSRGTTLDLSHDVFCSSQRFKTYKLAVERLGRYLQGVALTAETATN